MTNIDAVIPRATLHDFRRAGRSVGRMLYEQMHGGVSVNTLNTWIAANDPTKVASALAGVEARMRAGHANDEQIEAWKSAFSQALIDCEAERSKRVEGEYVADLLLKVYPQPQVKR
jgi:hypothetical protein